MTPNSTRDAIATKPRQRCNSDRLCHFCRLIKRREPKASKILCHGHSGADLVGLRGGLNRIVSAGHIRALDQGLAASPSARRDICACEGAWLSSIEAVAKTNSAHRPQRPLCNLVNQFPT